MTVLLTRKAVLQAAMESVYNTPASVGTYDGQLVSNPAFTVTPNVLERTFVHADLSPQPILIGRKLAKMTFETELRGNGLQQSGMVAQAPILTRLLNACGYALMSNPGGAALGPYGVGAILNPVVWAISSGALASDTFTATGQFAAGDIVHIGNKPYTFQSSLTNIDGNVWIGANEGAGLANLMNAINLGAGAGTAYAAATTAQPDGVVATSTSTTLTVTAPAMGTKYNSVATTYTAASTSEGAWAHRTIQGGRTSGRTTTRSSTP